MSKAGNWVPLDKGLIKTLPDDRPYSYVEAMFSHTVDLDCAREWSINGYAKLWKWSRNKVRNFIDSIRTGRGHLADRKGTGKGHPVHLIDGALWGEEDRKRTGRGQEEDRKRDTTIDPNPNPNPKEEKNSRSRSFVKPSFEEVKKYCEERKNGVDPKKWFDYYTANGFRVGKNPMKDWKAAVRTWENNGGKKNATNNGKNKGFIEPGKPGKTDWTS